MQTHKFIGKSFEIEYSSVNFSELGEELRVDAQFFDVLYLENENLIKSKTYCKIDTLLDKKQYGLSLAMNEDNIGYKILKMDDIIGILASEDNAKFVDIEERQFLGSKLELGDVLFNRVNSEEYVGRTGIYLMDGDYTFASYLVRLRAKEYYTNFYITMFLNSKQGRLSLDRVKRRAVNQANINAVELGNLNIPIPSPNFQQKIEELVVKSYKEKEKSQSLYKEAENILLQELNLLDFQPSTKEFNLFHQLFTIEKNSSIIKYSNLLDTDRLDAEYWDNKYLEIQDRIDGISVNRLGNLVDYKKGIEVGTGKYIEDSETELVQDKKYFIRVSNISKQGLSFGSPKYITKETFEDLQDYQPQQGEILFSKDGTAGISYLLREDVEGIISGGILRLQNKSDIQSEYIELVLNSILIQSEIEKTTNGALIQHLKIEDALNFNIPIISEEKRNEIADKIQQSFIAKEQSKKLLEVAKKGVEKYIEETEEIGLKYIEQNI